MRALLILALTMPALADEYEDYTYVELEMVPAPEVEICGNEIDDNADEQIDAEDLQCIVIDEFIVEECSPEYPCDEADVVLGVFGGTSDGTDIEPPNHTFIEPIGGLNVKVYAVAGGRLPKGTVAFTHSPDDAKWTVKNGLGRAFSAIRVPDPGASLNVKAYDFGVGPQITLLDLDNEVGLYLAPGTWSR